MPIYYKAPPPTEGKYTCRRCALCNLGAALDPVPRFDPPPNKDEKYELGSCDLCNDIPISWLHTIFSEDLGTRPNIINAWAPGWLTGRGTVRHALEAVSNRRRRSANSLSSRVHPETWSSAYSHVAARGSRDGSSWRHPITALGYPYRCSRTYTCTSDTCTRPNTCPWKLCRTFCD